MTPEQTTEELLAVQSAIESDPANRMPLGSLYLFTPSASRKLDAIRRAIANNLIDAKKRAGTYVDASGYSGRQSNRRYP